MARSEQSPGGGFRRWMRDIGLALAFLSRLPVAASPAPGALARAAYAFPLAGLALGAAAGLVYWLVFACGLYPPVAAVVAVAFQVWLTRGLHEDGLADFADGMAGTTPQRRLEIMRDSRIGGFGAMALILTLALRIAAIAEIADPWLVLAALAAAAALSRAALPLMLHRLPAARADGLAVAAGRPEARATNLALGIGLAVAFLLLAWPAAGAGLVVGGLAVAVVARLAREHLGGVTGDVLGAAQQAGETGFLLAAAALLA